MPTTYSTSLKLSLIGDGEQSGTWGQTTNINLGTLLEQAITGVVAITMTDANYTLSSFNGVSDEARNAVLVVGGTNTAQRDIIAPAVEKLYAVKNSTGQNLRIKTSSGTAITIPNGVTTTVYCDGTDFFSQMNGTAGNFSVTGNATVSGTLAVTGATTLSTALGAASGGTGLSSPGTAGNVLTSNGSAWVSTAPSPFTTGMIMLWSGSIATIPSGWALCNGSSGTPDLRDRFIVGAGSTYAVAATGGSADAIVVSHNHTATSSVTDPGHTHSGTVGSASFTPQGGSGPSTPFQSTSIGSNTTGITVSTSVASTGSSGTNANLPPYYALAYIMKL